MKIQMEMFRKKENRQKKGGGVATQIKISTLVFEQLFVLLISHL